MTGSVASQDLPALGRAIAGTYAYAVEKLKEAGLRTPELHARPFVRGHYRRAFQDATGRRLTDSNLDAILAWAKQNTKSTTLH